MVAKFAWSPSPPDGISGPTAAAAAAAELDLKLVIVFGQIRRESMKKIVEIGDAWLDATIDRKEHDLLEGTIQRLVDGQYKLEFVPQRRWRYIGKVNNDWLVFTVYVVFNGICVSFGDCERFRVTPAWSLPKTITSSSSLGSGALWTLDDYDDDNDGLQDEPANSTRSSKRLRNHVSEGDKNDGSSSLDLPRVATAAAKLMPAKPLIRSKLSQTAPSRELPPLPPPPPFGQLDQWPREFPRPPSLPHVGGIPYSDLLMPAQIFASQPGANAFISFPPTNNTMAAGGPNINSAMHATHPLVAQLMMTRQNSAASGNMGTDGFPINFGGFAPPPQFHMQQQQLPASMLPQILPPFHVAPPTWTKGEKSILPEPTRITIVPQQNLVAAVKQQNLVAAVKQQCPVEEHPPQEGDRIISKDLVHALEKEPSQQ